MPGHAGCWAGHPGPEDASVARQTIGIVLRDFGDATAAIGELRAALRLARLARSAERQSDVQATLGVAMVVSGRTAAGLAALDAAAREAAEPLASRVLVRRGIALLTLGRHQEALRDLHRAMTKAAPSRRHHLGRTGTDHARPGPPVTERHHPGRR